MLRMLDGPSRLGVVLSMAVLTHVAGVLWAAGNDVVDGKRGAGERRSETYHIAMRTMDNESANAPEKTVFQVTALTFNIRLDTPVDGSNRWDLRREHACAVLAREAADFVGLQEVLPAQAAFIRESLANYGMLIRSREADAARGEAVPLLYRRDRWKPDPRHQGTYWLSETPEVPGSKSWQSSLPRVTTWARFTHLDSGRTIWVYNTHFDHRSEQARTEAARLMSRRIVEHAETEPALVMGDLNSVSSTAALKTFVGPPLSLVDAYMAAHPDAPEPGTFHAFSGKRDGMRIDYVLASPGNDLRVVGARVLYDHEGPRYISDHFPVQATIDWTLPIANAKPDP